MKSEIQPCPTSTKAGTGTYITTGEIKSMLCHTCISIIPMCVLVYYSHGSVLYSTPHPAEGCTIRRGAVTHNTQPMHWATMQHLRGLMLKQSMLFTLKKCKNTTFWKPVYRKPFQKPLITVKMARLVAQNISAWNLPAMRGSSPCWTEWLTTSSYTPGIHWKLQDSYHHVIRSMQSYICRNERSQRACTRLQHPIRGVKEHAQGYSTL